MKMKWKLLNKDPKRGNATKKRRNQEEHPHQHTWPGAGEPWKGKGKEKARADGRADQDPRRGEDGSAWTNLHRRKTKPAYARTGQAYLEKGARMKLGTNGG